MPPAPGDVHEVTLVVPPEQTADAMGNHGVMVFATPFLISLLENAANGVPRPSARRSTSVTWRRPRWA